MPQVNVGVKGDEHGKGGNGVKGEAIAELSGHDRL